jgi:hypothetical protein
MDYTGFPVTFLPFPDWPVFSDRNLKFMFALPPKGRPHAHLSFSRTPLRRTTPKRKETLIHVAVRPRETSASIVRFPSNLGSISCCYVSKTASPGERRLPAVLLAPCNRVARIQGKNMASFEFIPAVHNGNAPLPPPLFPG